VGAALAALFVCGWLSVRGRQVFWLIGITAAAVALEVLSPASPAAVGIYVAIASAAYRLPVRPGAAFAAVSAVAWLIATALVHPAASLLGIGFSGISFAFTFTLGAGIRRIRTDRERLEDLLAELEASRDAQIRAARLAERTHLAREIHDVLAHTLSALALQLEGARLLAEQRPGDPAVAAAIERAHALARGGLDETRRAVGALRGDTPPGPDLLPRLVEDFERDTGTPCHLLVEGHPRLLPPDAALALYRAAQEALTNVRKHVDADEVTVRLRYDTSGSAGPGEVDAHVPGDGIQLVVEDRGRPRPTLGKGGYGLAGVRERAALLGGTLETGPTPGGFRMRLWLPRTINPDQTGQDMRTEEAPRHAALGIDGAGHPR
jgi:signal transduction histidine kinase